MLQRQNKTSYNLFYEQINHPSLCHASNSYQLPDLYSIFNMSMYQIIKITNSGIHRRNLMVSTLTEHFIR